MDRLPYSPEQVLGCLRRALESMELDIPESDRGEQLPHEVAAALYVLAGGLACLSGKVKFSQHQTEEYMVRSAAQVFRGAAEVLEKVRPV